MVDIFYIKECDYVKFKKDVKKKELLRSNYKSKVNGKYMIWDRDMDTIISGNALLKELIMDKNNSLADLGLKEYWNVFASEKHKYEATRRDIYYDLIIVHLRFMQPEFNQIDVKQTTMDKFANFGGNFGIFAEITGVSFLGILNLCILLIKILFKMASQC